MEPSAAVDELLKQDTDGDGKVSLEETLAPERERFKEMDADGDGVVTGEEASAAFKARIPPEILEKMKAGGMPEIGEVFLKRLDANGDGKVDPAEFEAPTAATFKVADADGDGFATKPEIEGFVDQMYKRVQERIEQMEEMEQQAPAPAQ
jgi:Ca2+-binding EF-hand superfamily protein